MLKQIGSVLGGFETYFTFDETRRFRELLSRLLITFSTSFAINSQHMDNIRPTAIINSLGFISARTETRKKPVFYYLLYDCEREEEKTKSFKKAELGEEGRGIERGMTLLLF